MTSPDILHLFKLVEFWALIYWLLVDYSFQSDFLPQTEDKPSPLTKEVRQTKEIGNKDIIKPFTPARPHANRRRNNI